MKHRLPSFLRQEERGEREAKPRRRGDETGRSTKTQRETLANQGEQVNLR